MNRSNQTTVGATALGGALATIVMVVVSIFVDLDGDQAAALGAAVATVAAAVFGYFAPSSTDGTVL